MNYYGTDADYIHLKFGDMRKAYNFTPVFRENYPNFCAEYEMYWNHDTGCRFESPLQIAQYIDRFNVPVNLYFNYTDTPVNNIEEVYEYLIREYAGIARDRDGKYRDDYDKGLDGEEPSYKEYKVKEQ